MWPGYNNSISPAVTSGNLVFVSRSNYVYSQTLQAFSINNGEEVWNINYGYPYVNPPSTDDKRVYIETSDSSDSNFYSHKATNGEILFKTPLGSQWQYYLAPTIYKSSVYTGGDNGVMRSFDKDTGKINWTVPLDRYDKWAPAVNDKISVAYIDGKLYVIERTSGKWLYAIIDPNYSWIGYSTDGAPVLVNNHTVVVAQSGYLTFFDLNKKEITHSDGPGFFGQPSTDGKQVFVSKNGDLTVIDANSMEKNWSWYKEGEEVTGQFIVTKNHIFLSTDKNTYVIDKKTHKEIWSYPGTGKLSLAKGHLFISSPYGYLVAIKVN